MGDLATKTVEDLSQWIGDIQFLFWTGPPQSPPRIPFMQGLEDLKISISLEYSIYWIHRIVQCDLRRAHQNLFIPCEYFRLSTNADDTE
jgi:hypothetical protein